jgi:putative sigma-54 modulation protein
MEMRIEFTGRNTPVTESFEDHAQRRLEKLGRISDRVGPVRVILSRQRGRTGVEITTDVAGALIRSEVKGPDERASFDSALEKLERQVRKYKDKLHRRSRDTFRKRPELEEGEESETEEPESEEEPVEAPAPRVVRTKSVTLKPMSPEEAALQMELLGHSFFLFRNADTDFVGVVYKRLDGDYGLLECET